MARYDIKTAGVVITDKECSNETFTASREQWEFATSLMECCGVSPRNPDLWNKVACIKLARSAFDMSLRDAKIMIEAAYQRRMEQCTEQI